MKTSSNYDELMTVVIRFVLVAFLFLCGCFINYLENILSY